MSRFVTPLVFVLCLATACKGRIGEQPVTEGNAERVRPTEPPRCDDPGINPSDVPLRRITDEQYRRTIAAVFDGVVTPSVDFPETAEWAGYSTAPEANVVSLLGAEEIMRAAEEVAAQTISRLPELLPCAPNADEACAREFISSFGSKVFRRPVKSDEQALLFGLFRDVAVDTPFRESIAVVLSAMLQMPPFLYLVEEGRPNVEVEPGVIPLSSFEIANRLSYMFVDGPPDDELYAAAQDGRLDTSEGIAEQARRLLRTSGAADMLTGFHREWLGVDKVMPDQKDPSVFPQFDAMLADAMNEEFDRFIGYAMTDLGGSFTALMTTDAAFVNQPLAMIYGIDPGLSSGPADWRLAGLGDARAGVLSRAAVLATHAHAAETSPVQRGKLVRTQFLCQDLPPPPPSAQTNVPNIPPDATQRETAEIFLASEDCGGCHRLMNPIGLGFENFDALGRWRDDHPNGRRIDASGMVEGANDMASFVGAGDLQQQLAASPAVHECVSKQWFRYAFGRREQVADRCAVESIRDDFVESGLNVKELLVGLTQTDAFRYRRTVDMQNRSTP